MPAPGAQRQYGQSGRGSRGAKRFVPKNSDPTSSSSSSSRRADAVFVPKSAPPTLTSSLRGPALPSSGEGRAGAEFVYYLPQDEAVASGFGVEDGGLDAVESQAVVDFLNSELSLLLKMNSKQFWEGVVRSSSLGGFIDSYLRFRNRWYDLPHRGPKGTIAGVLIGETDLSRRVFMTLYRMSLNKDPSANSGVCLDSKEHAALLQEKKWLDLPKLMDICAIYGLDNASLTRMLVTNAVKSQPNIIPDISSSLSHFLSIIYTMHQRCASSLEMAENNEVDIEVSDDDNLESTSSNRGSKTAPHFTLLVDGNYRCKKCKESRPSKEVIIKKDKTGSTCGRWRHLKKVHPGIFRTLRPIKGQPSVADIYKKTDEQEAQFVDINFDSLKEAICKLICRMDLPFTSSEHPAFKEYSDFLARQNLSLPAARTIRETALKKFDEGKEILRNRLDPIRLVSLTIDSWTSENQVAILGITIHWIDEDWNLCERVLATEELKGEHSGENMANMVHDVLKDYNLTKKLCAITTDNASNNGTMAAELENLLGSPGIIFNKECHMPCMGHIINLAVQEGLKNLDVQGTPAKEAHDEFFHPFQVTARDTLGCLLLRVRELVKAAKRNPQRIAYYKVICKEKNQNENMLQLDVPTRWNSTHEMIDIAWQKREVLTKMVKDLMFISKHNLSIMDDEWHILKIFSDGLKLFQDSTKLLSTSKRVSASTALSVLDALISELDSQFSNITKIAGRGLNMQQAVALKNTYMAMKGKLLKYSNILQKKPSFAIAALLDPQYKLSFISSENTSFVCSSLLKYFEKVMDASISQHKTTIGGSEANEDVSPSSQDGSLKRAECDNSILETIKRRRPIIKEVEKTGKEELDEFLRGPYTNNCALDWWRSTGSQRYPCLAVLAKGFLAIPATSTPAERLFSTGRGIVTYKRGKLNAESITTLMTLKCWIKEDCHDLANLEASVDDVDAQLRVP